MGYHYEGGFIVQEMVLSAPGFVELSMDEVFSIDGGVDWEEVGKGLLLLAVTVVAIATLPATLPLIVQAAIVFVGAYGGYQVVDGLLTP